MMAQASARFGVPIAWIARVITSESAGETEWNGKPITSIAGAMGLMQIMPATYAELRRRYDFGADPYDPGDNIGAGTAYLSELNRRYGYPALFAAYHAGPKRYEDFLLRRDPLPRPLWRMWTPFRRAFRGHWECRRVHLEIHRRCQKMISLLRSRRRQWWSLVLWVLRRIRPVSLCPYPSRHPSAPDVRAWGASRGRDAHAIALS